MNRGSQFAIVNKMLNLWVNFCKFRRLKVIQVGPMCILRKEEKVPDHGS